MQGSKLGVISTMLEPTELISIDPLAPGTSGGAKPVTGVHTDPDQGLGPKAAVTHPWPYS